MPYFDISLKDARQKEELSQQQVANKIGVSLRTYQRMEKDPSKLSLETINDLMTIFVTYNDIPQKTDAPCNLYYLEKISQRVSAGNGEESLTCESEPFPICKSLFMGKINEEEYKVIEVIGDSMEPTIKDGDHTIIKNSNSFQGDGLYVIRKGNELYVKRVIKNIDGSCIIKSDNPNYPDMHTNKEADEQHFIIGKVKAILPKIEL